MKTWLWLITLTVMSASALSLSAQQTNQTIDAIKPIQATGNLGKPSAGLPEGKGKEGKENEGQIISVAAFSDIECGSDWCNRHEPKDGQIALNLRKWPGAKFVYIPVYEKKYRVVGTTYSETGNHYDAEIWFGQARDAALEFGSKKLLATFIY